MAWLIGSVLYGLAAVVAARLIAGHFAYSMAANAERKWPSLHRDNTGRPNGDQWFGAACMASIVAVVWPLALTIWMLPFGNVAIGAEAHAIRKQREEWIAELERELDLR